jgi:hypothetical protein
MPATLRHRTGYDTGAVRTVRSAHRSDWVTTVDLVEQSSEVERSSEVELRRRVARPGLANAFVGWIGLAVALSIGSVAFVYSREQVPGDSVVTAWVAGVVAFLALGPCVLFVVSAHRDMRRWLAPAGALAIPAVLGVNLVVGLL